MVKFASKAAEQGDLRYQHRLGDIYDKKYGVSENNKTALKWFTKAAAQGMLVRNPIRGVM